MKFSGLALAFAGTALAQSNQSLTEVLAANSGLSSLAGLLNTPGVSLPSNLTNITLLAPNNEAIGAFLNTSTAAALTSDSALISAVLSYHILRGNYSNITNTSFIPTLVEPPQFANVTGGQRVQAVAAGGNVTFFSGLLQNSSVVNASIPFNGGTIHVINRLLTLPQNISTTGVALNLTSAVGAITALNLTQTVDHTEDVTIFVPDNAAFSAIGSVLNTTNTTLLTEVLSYHVVAGSVLYSTNIMNGSNVTTLAGGNITLREVGGNVYVNNARVIRPNVLVANGVVHVIDRVLNPANSTIAPNTATTEQAFAGATSASEAPFTSGVPTPTSAIDTQAVSSAVASASSTSSGAAWAPMQTGAVGAAALFGGAAALFNL